MAGGDPKTRLPDEESMARRDPPGSNTRPRNERVSDDLPFDSRGGLAFRHYFPVDAEYTIRVIFNNANQNPLEMSLPVKAGLRTVGAAFLRESTKAEVEAPVARRGASPAAPPRPAPPAAIDVRLAGPNVQP